MGKLVSIIFFQLKIKWYEKVTLIFLRTLAPRERWTSWYVLYANWPVRIMGKILTPAPHQNPRKHSEEEGFQHVVSLLSESLKIKNICIAFLTFFFLIKAKKVLLRNTTCDSHYSVILKKKLAVGVVLYCSRESTFAGSSRQTRTS